MESKNFTFLYLRFTHVNISRYFIAYFLHRLSLYLIFFVRFFPNMKWWKVISIGRTGYSILRRHSRDTRRKTSYPDWDLNISFVSLFSLVSVIASLVSLSTDIIAIDQVSTQPSHQLLSWRTALNNRVESPRGGQHSSTSDDIFQKYRPRPRSSTKIRF